MPRQAGPPIIPNPDSKVQVRSPGLSPPRSFASTLLSGSLVECKKRLFQIQILWIKGLLLLHQRPGDYEKFCSQLHPHLRLNPRLSLSPPQLIGKINHKMPILVNGGNGGSTLVYKLLIHYREVMIFGQLFAPAHRHTDCRF